MDLPSADVLFEALSEQQTKIKLFYIKEDDIAANDDLIPQQLDTVRGTMKIHQIFTNTPAQFKWRILSCFCSAPDECKCYGPQSVTMCKGPTTANGASSIDVPLMDAQTGCWCAVKYDREVYPGIVQDVDAENCILVKTMSRPHDFLGLIPPPQPVTKRHMMLPVDVCEKLFSH
ncbi:hypothetical protein ABG768_019011 [Culter alburnus]|uniref:Uncharacterized protein n=1 Tax=Culter alburnus TaxID=194366 RepID=A0AAW2AYP2_CULAL